MKYDTAILFAWNNDTRIHIQSILISAVPILNDVFISGQVEWHFQTSAYLYLAACLWNMMLKLTFHCQLIHIFHSHYMNDRSIISQTPFHIKIGGVTFTKLLLSSLNNIFMIYNTNSFCAFSRDNSIHIRIKPMTPVSFIPVPFTSG